MFDSWNKTTTFISKWATFFDNKLQHSACGKITSHQNFLKYNLEKPTLITWCSEISSKSTLFHKIKSYLILESMHLMRGYPLSLIDYCCVVWENCTNGLRKRTARLKLDQDSIARQAPLFKQNWDRWCTEQTIKHYQ